MNKEWKQPSLEVLDVKMTFAGVGLTIPDSFDPDEKDQHHS
ncbi:paeninodin family lasso peptide [Cohnella luojiensis]|uniref:Paeninodin family lasso peptide n=1 Tax=Cohnella luojiensis TaxID=652876 RepID=A0A4Y8LNQ0_9BACL|nr:paeninodin family lasso peptide [Cohnella luojiensis]TFE22628.1 paeninodin family lasso peptide [Cohnella luojiensis]